MFTAFPSSASDSVLFLPHTPHRHRHSHRHSHLCLLTWAAIAWTPMPASVSEFLLLLPSLRGSAASSQNLLPPPRIFLWNLLPMAAAASSPPESHLSQCPPCGMLRRNLHHACLVESSGNLLNCPTATEPGAMEAPWTNFRILLLILVMKPRVNSAARFSVSTVAIVKRPAPLLLLLIVGTRRTCSEMAMAK